MRSFVHSVYKAASEAVLPPKSRSSFKEDGVRVPLAAAGALQRSLVPRSRR